jgi:hypothetical protein
MHQVGKVQGFNSWLVESFNFQTWKRLQSLGLAEDTLDIKAFHFKGVGTLKDRVPIGQFGQLAISLGLVVLMANQGLDDYQVVIAGPVEAFAQMEEWLTAHGAQPIVTQHVVAGVANSALAIDRWRGIADSGEWFTTSGAIGLDLDRNLKTGEWKWKKD